MVLCLLFLVGLLARNLYIQLVVTLSTTEVEYITITEAIKETIWLKDITHELRLYSGMITLYCDNQNTIHLAKNNLFLERSI